MNRLTIGFILAIIPALAAAENTTPPGAAPTAVFIGTPSAPVIDTANAPRIRFENKKWNFGKVMEGPDVITLFHFTNKGKSPLKIESVQTSCGCTAAEAEGRTEIPPGETGAIHVKYSTKDRPGPASKTITVLTNDPANQSVVLTIEVDVVRLIDVQPARVTFYNMKKGESRTLQVKVLGKEGLPLKILSAKSTSGTVAVSMTALREGTRRGATIDVTLAGDKPIGMIGDDIVLATSSKKNPEMHITVIGEVLGRVQVFPKMAYLTGTTGTTVSLQVNAFPAEGFKVLKAKAAKGQVNTRVRKTKTADGKDKWWVDVSIPWLQRLGPLVDEVTLSTNDPEQPAINIPVSGEKTKKPQR